MDIYAGKKGQYCTTRHYNITRGQQCSYLKSRLTEDVSSDSCTKKASPASPSFMNKLTGWPLISMSTLENHGATCVNDSRHCLEC